jgi:Tfp pilus assembly protein PilX
MDKSLIKHRQRNFALNPQRGATSLFVTMVVLLVVMLLGVTAALLSGTQFKLAANLQGENTAFNNAESAVAVAQTWLKTGTNSGHAGFTTYNSATTPWLYPSTQAVDPMTMTWSNSNSLAVNGSQRYIIQKIGQNMKAPGNPEIGGAPMSCGDRVDMFRISAFATGAKGTTKLMQTTYTGTATC